MAFELYGTETVVLIKKKRRDALHPIGFPQKP